MMPITAETRVAEALRCCAPGRAANVFRREGLGACLGCAFAPFDSLEYAAREHGLDVAALVAALAREAARG